MSRASTTLTNDKGYGTSPDEDEGWVQSYVGQLGQVVECVLLSPGPDPDSQDPETQELQRRCLTMFLGTTL